MTNIELSTRLKERLHPEPYDDNISPSGNFDFILKSKSKLPGGRYAVGFAKLSEKLSRDQFSKIRSEAQKLTKSMWMFRETGIYIILCGPEQFWKDHTQEITADKTGLHNIIVNAIHFIDPETKSNHLSTSSWGPVEFGDVKLVSNIIEEEIKQPQPPD